MATPADTLVMTLTDVAGLARVQRPVVSMWRKRSEGTPHPFPKPVATYAGRELFDAHQVGAWLSATGRGNNPEAPDDVAAFARMPATVAPATAAPGNDGNRTTDALTALLTLKTMTGAPLGTLGGEELLDLADECDPDDLFLYSELTAAGSSLAAAAAFADRLVDSSYNAAAAFEQLLAARFKAGLREHADTALTEPAVDLVISAAVALAETLGSEPVFVDPTRGGSDLLLGIVRATAEDTSPTFLTTDDDGGAGRLVRRRLRVHGVADGQVKASARGEFTVDGPAVHVAQYPAPGDPGMDTLQILAAIDHLVLQMDDRQRAVVIAPARVLTDASGSAAADRTRSGLLRTGRVRAIVRLPQGLLRAKPREAQALWVLGPSFAEVSIGERWTMTADLSARQLTEDVCQDLVSDIVASMGNRATVRAHSFRFARLILTRALLAGRGSLVAAQSAGLAGRLGGAEASLRIEELIRLLAPGTPTAGAAPEQAHAFPAATPRTPAPDTHPAPTSIEDLLNSGTLRYIKGNRLDADTLTAAVGTRTIGVEELSSPHDAPSRFIGLLDFAANNPSGRLTEPGDVVFCTSPRPAARVDPQGGSAVVYPARVLRIDAGDPGGLLPDVVAADVNALPAADKTWRQWRLRRVADAQRLPLEKTLTHLQHEQQQARERLHRLEELATLITDGVAGGSLTLTDPRSTLAAAPTEGTR